MKKIILKSGEAVEVTYVITDSMVDREQLGCVMQIKKKGEIMRKATMKTWRPDGWDNPYEEGSSCVDEYTDDALHSIYEASADALLKALKSQCCDVITGEGISITVRCEHSVSTYYHQNGWLIYIPNKGGYKMRQKGNEAYQRGIEQGKKEMLAALKKEGMYCYPHSFFDADGLEIWTKAGWQVFLEDEKLKEA